MWGAVIRTPVVRRGIRLRGAPPRHPASPVRARVTRTALLAGTSFNEDRHPPASKHEPERAPEPGLAVVVSKIKRPKWGQVRRPKRPRPPTVHPDHWWQDLGDAPPEYLPTRPIHRRGRGLQALA